MFYNRLWLWLLKKLKNMCNCKNKCNCSSSDFGEGLNGYNSFNYTTAQFAIPAADNTTPVTINVKSERPWTGEAFGIGSFVFIEGNYFRVTNVTESTITVVNPANSTDYTSNDAPGTLIPANSKIIQSGIQGPPVTLPRRSVMVKTDSFNFFVPTSSGYQDLMTGFITDYLTESGDCLEMDYIVQVSGGEAAKLKIAFGGATIHEITDLGTGDGFRYVYHKIKLIRGNNNTSFFYLSDITYSNDFSTGITDNRVLDSRQLKLFGNITTASSLSNLTVNCQIDIGSAFGAQAGLVGIKFTPYDN